MQKVDSILEDLRKKCLYNRPTKIFTENEITAISLLFNEEKISKTKLSQYFKCRIQRIDKIIELLSNKKTPQEICNIINN
jgi:hypothetical protein